MKASDHNRLSYFVAIVEAFDGMVYVCSPNNRIEYVNRQAAAQLRRDPVGESCHKALYGNDDICPWCRELDVFGGKTFRWEFKNLVTERWYYNMASPIRHSDGSVSKLSLSFELSSVGTHIEIFLSSK